MNFFDEARSYKGMLEGRKMTQKKLADFLGVSQPYVANKLRLLSFSEDEEKLITEGGLSERHAREILRLPTSNMRLEMIEKCISGNYSVARCEIAVDCMLDSIERDRNEFTSYTNEIESFAEKLESSLSILRRFGIRARSSREDDEYNIYFRIKIEK